MRFLRASLLLIVAHLYASAWGNPYSAHIKKAAAYLTKRGEALNSDAVLTLEILQRNFDVFVNTADAKRRLLEKRPRRLVYVMRVLDRSAALSQLEISVIRGWRGLLAQALHCDLYPLSWDFLQKVRKLSARDEFEVPAGILVLAIATWMPCDLDQERLKAEKDNLAVRIPEILNRTEPGSAAWIDALEALFQADKFEWIKREYLQALCNLQLPNGSWKNNDLLTAKALSILLQATEINNPDKPRRPALKILPKVNPSVS